jgi:predicted peroxiredoxin
MPMRGLTVVVTTADPDRLRAGLTMACAAAALGGRARVYLHEGAVALLAQDTPAPATGLPSLAELRAVAVESAVAVVACQTGLALAALSAEVAGVQAGGMIELLATLGDDRLVAL